MPFHLPDLAPVACAFGLAVMLTPGVRWLARRWGAVAQPRPDRWHKKPTALLGGVAIFLAVAVTQLAVGPSVSNGMGWMIGAAFMFLVGLTDDLRRIRPYQKLTAQLLAAGIVMVDGQSLSSTGSPVFDGLVTVLWLVGVTNALNLIDNVDGLAAGVAAISAGFFAAYFLRHRDTNEAIRLAAFAAALLGFLIYNFNPASIFMGDGGSQFIGFYLATTALQTGSSSDNWLVNVFVLVLFLAVPIFDTSFVTITRLRERRPISQGGRDHTSHRLIALGLSERTTVCVMYVVAIFAGYVGLNLGALAPFAAILVIGLTIGATAYAGILLSRVRPRS